MFSKRGSMVLAKGKPLRARQPCVEVKASSTGEFMRADKFEKSEQGGSRALNFIYCAAAVQGFRTLIQVRGGLFVYSVSCHSINYCCTSNVQWNLQMCTF